ncbi:MAG: hypothetical protein ACLVAW_17875 [Eisenbergiella massiliensis]
MCTVHNGDDMDLREGLAYSLEAEGYSIVRLRPWKRGRAFEKRL